MDDRVVTTTASVSMARADTADELLTALRDRVHRLEDVVASLQHTEQLEDRITARVSERVRRTTHSGHADSLPAPRLLDVARRLLPAPSETPRLDDVPRREEPRPSRAPSQGWFLLDAWLEIRAIWRMYLDPRHRMSRLGRLLPPILALLILTSWIWLPGMLLLPSTVATVIVKVVDLALAYLLCKVLSREARTYRETSPDLPTALRL